MNPEKRLVFIVLCAFAEAIAMAYPPLYRPSREQRTLNTAAYELIIQKNGHIGIYQHSGIPIFMDVVPIVWFEGEEEPRMLKVDGRRSLREDVHDRLGEGQGMVLVKDNCHWVIRTYPAKPFLTAQVVFTNTTKKPVRVKMLSPWSTGKSGGVTLGPGAPGVTILENGRVFAENDDYPKLVQGESLSQWNAAIYNPGNRQSIITGFLTHNRSYTQIRIAPAIDDELADFRRFHAECMYDAPVEVAPGGKLESEVLYLSVAESTPHEGLERYAHAYAVANNISRNRKFLPHGWDSWNTRHRTGINEAVLLAELDVLDRNLKRYGWNHFAIDDGWQIARGNWEPDPAKFPNGMKFLADQIHSRSMTAGIWTAPFTVSPDAPIATEHPEWLRDPNAIGKMLLHEGDKILDVTAPGAYEHVREMYRKIRYDWGFDALMEADYVYHLLLAESYHDPALTRIEVLRKGMQAIREGFGRDGFIMSFTPHPVTANFANGLRIGTDCAPLWRKDPVNWPLGCVETLTASARRYYFAPYCYVPDQDCAYFAHAGSRERWSVKEKPELTREQSIAWLTGAALTAGVVKIGDAWSDLDRGDVEILRRLLPTPEFPARPVDLFESEHPRIWSLPVSSPIGNWNIVAVFNWDEKDSATVPLSLESAGMQPHAYYAVYDFWYEKYFGIAQEKLSVTVPAGSVRLLTFRERQPHPMFLSVDNHILQGATDFKALGWDSESRTLTGTFTGVAETAYTIRVLVPDGYVFTSAQSSAGETRASQDGAVVKLQFYSVSGGEITWSAVF